jgi:hypothetical protein
MHQDDILNASWRWRGGNPPPNSVKYFAASDLLEQVKDRAWLARVTNVLNHYWKEKNGRRKRRLLGEGVVEAKPSEPRTCAGRS